MTFVHEAPLIGHGTGSIADLFSRSAIGQTGSRRHSHGQSAQSDIWRCNTAAVLAGAAVLLAMWIAHYFLFRFPGWIAWVGTVVVVENVVSSLAHSHSFDFMHGWLYVFGVGVVGGMVLRQSQLQQSEAPAF